MAQLLLCIDIGNTNIVLGLYEHDELVTHWRVASDHARMPDEYAVLILALFARGGYSERDVRGIAISSVVPPLTATFEELCQSHFGHQPLVVGAGVKTGVRIRYDSPRDVGADRITNAVAVRSMWSAPTCVVDFGTATTFDAISGDGDYLGGAIAPGIGIASEALFARTAKLPRVELTAPEHAIGGNTIEALQSGLLFGYVGLVEGMVARFRRELGESMRTVGTGGLADVIARHSPVFDVIDPWLTLKGLRLIYHMNR